MQILARHKEHLALALLVLLACLSSFAWVALDTRPQPGADPNTYLIKAFELVDSLKAQGGADLWQLIIDASIQGRPPLYQLFTVPFIFLFGRSEDVALCVNLISLVILILATYGIGNLAWNRRAGLLAGFLVATYPPIIQLSTIYVSHAWLPAWVAVSVWELLLLLKTRSIKVAWLLGVSLSIGMLIHPNFLYLIPMPAIVICLYVLFFENPLRYPPSPKKPLRWMLLKLKDPFMVFGLLPAGLIAVGFVAAWYIPNSQSILALQNAVAIYWSNQTMGFGGIPYSFWWYALTAPGAISNVLVILFLMGFVACLFLWRKGPLALWTTFVGMYVCLSLRQGVYGWSTFSAVLPVVAAITSIGILAIGNLILKFRSGIIHMAHSIVMRSNARVSQLMIPQGTTLKPILMMPTEVQAGKYRPISIALALICVGVASFNFYFVAWGNGSWSQPIASILVAPLDSNICNKRSVLAFCPVPPQHDNWQVDKILDFILAQPDCRSHGCNLVVVPKQDTFNSILFDYTLLRDFPQSRKTIHISSADGWGGAPGDAQWVLGDYLVYIPFWRGQDALREIQIGTAVTQLLESPPPIFADLHQEIASFTLPGGLIAKLVKRSQSTTIEKEIQSYEEALRWVPVDIMLYEKLGFLYLRTDNWSRSEEVFQKASQIDPHQGWPYKALGYLYREHGLDDQAVAAFRKAIEIEPYDPNAYRSLAELFEATGNFRKAIEVYKLAVQQNQVFVWPYLSLGSLYVHENQLAEAKSVFQTVSWIEPRNPEVQGNLNNYYWSPALELGAVKAYAGSTPLEWWRGESWVKPYPAPADVLVGSSDLDVGGQVRPDQIHMAPSSADQPTVLRFNVKDCQFYMLQIGAGLADQVAGLSNGVRYTVQVSADGGRSYHVLLDESITEAVWRSQAVSLTAYWGKDLTFELVVESLGDDSYDWLQTTVRLFPAHMVWNLASSLSAVQASTDQAPLSWSSPDAWVDGKGRQLVTISHAPVQGRVQENQVLFHPQSYDQDTTITLFISDNPYTNLNTAFALADEAVGRSNGVRYTVALSTDGKTYTNLLEKDVSRNTWDTATIDLHAYLHQALKVRLVSSSKSNDSYDWLQITLELLSLASPK
jgi:tetratricopeptide (TPR) repeat protein